MNQIKLFLCRRHVWTVTEHFHKNSETNNHTSSLSGAKIYLKCFYSFLPSFLPSCFVSLLPPFLATFNIFFHSINLCFLNISSFLPSWLVYYIFLPCFLWISSFHYRPFCHNFPLPSLCPCFIFISSSLTFLIIPPLLLPSLLISCIVLTPLYWFLYHFLLPSLFFFLPSWIDSSHIPSSLPSFLTLSVWTSCHHISHLVLFICSSSLHFVAVCFITSAAGLFCFWFHESENKGNMRQAASCRSTDSPQ